MQKTRQLILGYLQTNPGTAAADLSRALDLTAANIRYHLEILLNQGFIQISGQRPAGGAGRPIQLYDLSARSLGDSLLPLVEALLAVLEDQPQLLESIAIKISEKLLNKEKNPINRYNQSIEFLNGLNYHASWGAHPDGPGVEFRHCPYRNLALTNPDICLIDQKLVSILFDLPLTLTQKREFGKNPYSPCLFEVTQEE